MSKRPVDVRVRALRRFATSITAFTIAGHLFLGMEESWAQPAVALATAYALELLLEAIDAWAHRRGPRFAGGLSSFVTFMLPAHISALSIGLLIYPSDALWPFAFAAAVAVGAKFLLRAPVAGSMRHVMNPSNVGIASTLVLFPWVGIAPPYHFTERFGAPLDWVIPLGVLGSGLFLNHKLTRKTPLIASWVGGFALQAVVRSELTDVALVGALAPMTGAAFILFTNYMITDPGTTPVRPRNQVVFGASAAAIYGAITAAHLVFGIFFCLIAVCLARGAVLWWCALADARRDRRAGVAVESRVPIGAGASR